jgi:hypothetical protein
VQDDRAAVRLDGPVASGLALSFAAQPLGVTFYAFALPPEPIALPTQSLHLALQLVGRSTPRASRIHASR